MPLLWGDLPLSALVFCLFFALMITFSTLSASLRNPIWLLVVMTAAILQLLIMLWFCCSWGFFVAVVAQVAQGAMLVVKSEKAVEAKIWLSILDFSILWLDSRELTIRRNLNYLMRWLSFADLSEPCSIPDPLLNIAQSYSLMSLKGKTYLCLLQGKLDYLYALVTFCN